MLNDVFIDLILNKLHKIVTQKDDPVQAGNDKARQLSC